MDPNPQAILDSDLEFETLISDLIRTTNIEKCSQAESLFILCKQTDSVNIVAKLVHLLEHSPHLDVRAMSTILLRNTLVQKPSAIRPPLWIRLLGINPVLLKRVKSVLLKCVRNEQNEPIINILGNTISMLAADNRFPELLDFMFDGFANVDIWLKKSTLHIFANLGEQYVKGYLVGRKIDLRTFFMDCLVIGDLRIMAFSAVIKFFHCLDYTDSRSSFKDLLPLMFECVAEATAQEALVLLIELAWRDWTIFTEGGWPRFLNIAEAERFEEGMRHLVSEVLITAVEEKNCNLEDQNLFFNRLCAILMRILLSDIEDEAAWYSAAWYSAENEDEDAGRSSNYIFRSSNYIFRKQCLHRLATGRSSNYIFQKQCLHRLATALGGNTIFPVVYEYLSAPNHEWQKHLAGLVALAQIAERLSKLVMIPNLEQVVTTVLNSIESHPDHPRVRLAAINVTAQLFADLDPDLQFEYHGLVLPALAGAMGEDPDSRVRLAAINVTVQLFANLDPEELPLTEEYHLSVIYALHGAICELGDLLVQERAVDAMISISINYLPNHISRILVVTVGTLLDLRRREDIASDQTRIIAIRNTLEVFEARLPHETWTKTFNSLRLDQRATCRSILGHGI